MLILVIYPQGLGIGVAEGVEKALQSVLGRTGVGTTQRPTRLRLRLAGAPAASARVQSGATV